MKRFRLLFAVLSLFGVQRATAQNDKIILGVTGYSKAQPGLVVLAGRGLDSVRAIVQRDLVNSDRYTVALMSDSAATLSAPGVR